MAANWGWQAPEIPDYYTNAVRMTFSPYDFFMELGLVIPPEAPAEGPLIKPVARVRISPQQALVLSKLLEAQLASFQDQNGAINLPPDALQFLESPK